MLANLVSRVRELLVSYEAEEPDASEFRAQQIRAVLKLTPLAMFANILNVTVVCLTFLAHPKLPFLIVWALLISLVVLTWLRPWLALRRGRVRRTASTRAIGRATKHAAILALLWGVLPVLMFPQGDAHTKMIVTVICSGMICAGGFALAIIPSAGLAYVLILTIGCIGGILLADVREHLDLAMLLLTYSFIVGGSVVTTAKTFGARLMAEAKAAHQQQVVGLLLNDFESHASDWLWEIDGQGYLQRMSTRVIEFFGLTRATLRNRTFIEYFGFPDGEQQEDERAAVEKLHHCLSQSVPFREVSVPVMVDGERRWWSLTAKPLFDGNGQPNGWRGVGSDVTQRRHAEIEMHRLANIDSLTGLANRHQFRQQLTRITPAAGSAVDRSCVLLYLDLDNFKNVNDSLGHGGGDRVLQTVAHRLLQRTRRGDLLARLGGDEFALISWEDSSSTHAAHIAERLLDAFRTPCLVDGVNLQVGSSIGIALSPAEGCDPDTLLKNADMALYAAKSSGRNTYRFFDPTMGEHVQHRLTMLNDLHEAVESDAKALAGSRPRTGATAVALFPFELHFQPQFHLRSGRITGLEGLIRWRHPSRGLLPPADFVPLLEESDLIVPVGAWVLREACARAMTWPGKQRVAVNVSAIQFARDAVVGAVQDALSASGLPPYRLELEITESLLIHDSSAALETLSQLRDLGVRIALDDFGTGYSSLAYLRGFPFDKLKIDRAFVTTLEDDASAHAIVRAIIQLADALNLETTAEGVESDHQAAILRDIGCTHAQGYLFARPMPADAVLDFFADSATHVTALSAGS